MKSRNDIIEYVRKHYGVDAEYLFAKNPDTAVFRHVGSKKWFGVLLPVGADKLGIGSADAVYDLLLLKSEPALISILLSQDGVLPAYHMNKTHWVSVIIGGAFPDDETYKLLDLSYELTIQKPKKKK